MPAPADVVIRPARPSDLRHLAGVEDSGGPLFAEAFGADIAPALLGPAPSVLDRDLAPGFLLVAERGGAVVGFAHVLDLEGHAHLEQLSVRPEHGRRGNGPFYARLGFAEVRDLAAYQRRLREHETAAGLDRNGVRVVMQRDVVGGYP